MTETKEHIRASLYALILYFVPLRDISQDALDRIDQTVDKIFNELEELKNESNGIRR